MKKILKVVAVIVAAFVLLLGYGVYLSLTKELPPEIVIDGKEFSTGDTIQDLLDAGFVIGNADREVYDVEQLEEIKGKTYSAEFFYVGKEGKKGEFEDTGVIVSLYNDSVVGCSFSQGKIYSFRYYLNSEDKSGKVTINGIDFLGMDKKEAVAAFEEKEMSFDEKKKEKFLNGESASLYVDSKDYFYILKEENGELYTIEVKMDIY